MGIYKSGDISKELEKYFGECIYFYDDFIDGQLTNKKVRIGSYNGNLVNLHRDWVIVSGEPSISNEMLNIHNGDVLYIPSKFTQGLWEYKIKIPSNATEGRLKCYVIYEKEDCYWVFGVWYDGKVYIDKHTESASVTIYAEELNLNDDMFHIYKIIRDGSGNWKFYLDDIEKKTWSDTYLPDNPAQMRIESDLNSIVTIDYIKLK
ncbi:hypothetical protein DRQ29_00335 [bacterium]|nr:MAG: hypothetical protein DRQ29_00335 [bacterium]